MRRTLAGAIASLVTVLALPAVALAHVVVTPSETGVGARTLFSVGVPNEKQVAVTSVKLDIPKGLQDVQPDVLAGWHIMTAQDDAGNVASITWTGDIPAGRRADLAFKAQAPAQPGELDWKAYQTYADGSVVRWDQKQADGGKDERSDAGPYSITKVVDDFGSGAPAGTASDSGSSKESLAFAFSIAALALSVSGLFLRRKR